MEILTVLLSIAFDFIGKSLYIAVSKKQKKLKIMNKFKNINGENTLFSGAVCVDGIKPIAETEKAKLFRCVVATRPKKIFDENECEYYWHVSESEEEVWVPNYGIVSSRGKLYIDNKIRREKRIIRLI